MIGNMLTSEMYFIIRKKKCFPLRQIFLSLTFEIWEDFTPWAIFTGRWHCDFITGREITTGLITYRLVIIAKSVRKTEYKEDVSILMFLGFTCIMNLHYHSLCMTNAGSSVVGKRLLQETESDNIFLGL